MVKKILEEADKLVEGESISHSSSTYKEAIFSSSNISSSRAGIFSQAGKILTPLRSRLFPDHFEI